MRDEKKRIILRNFYRRLAIATTIAHCPPSDKIAQTARIMRLTSASTILSSSSLTPPSDPRQEKQAGKKKCVCDKGTPKPQQHRVSPTTPHRRPKSSE